MAIFPGQLQFIKAIFSSLQSRNYRVYFIGQSVSLIGTWMQHIALSWLVYRLTGSVFLLGVTGFASQIPIFILSPFTGVLTDRFNRLKVMLIAQILFMVQASVMAALVLTGYVQVWHIITLSLFFGIISALDAPARQSLVVDLISDPSQLGNAIALNSAIFNSARLIGPGIAGVLIALVGEGVCFTINALSYLSVIIALLNIKVPRKIAPKALDLKNSFAEGYRYTFGFAPIRVTIVLLAIVSLLGLSFTVLMPAYARETLHGNADTLGFLMSAAGAGALAGALFMASRKTVLGLGRLISYNTLFFGLGVIVVSASTALYLSLVALAFIGLTMIISVASINTLIQTISVEDKRGRVMSFYAMALMGMTPIGNLLAGTIAHNIGISWTMFGGGLITALAGIWFMGQHRLLQAHIMKDYRDKEVLGV